MCWHRVGPAPPASSPAMTGRRHPGPEHPGELHNDVTQTFKPHHIDVPPSVHRACSATWGLWWSSSTMCWRHLATTRTGPFSPSPSRTPWCRPPSASEEKGACDSEETQAPSHKSCRAVALALLHTPATAHTSSSKLHKPPHRPHTPASITSTSPTTHRSRQGRGRRELRGGRLAALALVVCGPVPTLVAGGAYCLLPHHVALASR